MDDRESTAPEERGVSFVPVKGSVIGGMGKEKTARITDAMADLQLGIDGLRGRLTDAAAGSPWTPMAGENRWMHSLASFARTCSVFLRKTVLGDRGKRETRLLDDRVLGSIELGFDPLRRIPRDRRRGIEVGLGLAKGFLEITKLDDRTRQPRETYRYRAGPQGLRLAIEWPLPGTADWIGVPSEDAPWPVRADQLFQAGTGSGMSCDEWLGQQVVVFDGKGISLKKMIQTVVNFEGAHSIDVGRLATFEGETASKAARNAAPHILNAVTFCGIRYAHLIVIESALYLYDKLLGADAIAPPSGDIYMITPGVTCSPEQATSSRPDWARFRGGMMISFSDAPQVVCHRIRAVS
ncbi:MAG: hypothetical protein F4Y41_19825 [Gammaproteobacteria bacterium]|nr:hypothetical protein [Gammaproteobacteria bacterium]MYI07074.1 hypothetical protein [Gemmatimonadota bacterium]